MKKSIYKAIGTILFIVVIGLCAMFYGEDHLTSFGGNPEFGSIVSIALVGGIIVFLDGKKKG